jgi:hypothetical protein
MIGPLTPAELTAAQTVTFILSNDEISSPTSKPAIL